MAKKIVRKSSSFDRFNNARAEKVELENEVSKAKMVYLSDVESEWKSLVLEYKRAVGALPINLSSMLVDISDPKKIYDIIFDEVMRIGERLAEAGEQSLKDLKNDLTGGVLPQDEEDDGEEAAAEAADEHEIKAEPGADTPPKKPALKSSKKAEQKPKSAPPEEAKDKKEPDKDRYDMGEINLRKYQI